MSRDLDTAQQLRKDLNRVNSVLSQRVQEGDRRRRLLIERSRLLAELAEAEAVDEELDEGEIIYAAAS